MSRPSRRGKLPPLASEFESGSAEGDGVTWETGGYTTGTLTVEESDGSPSVAPVDTVKFNATDFTVTDGGDGSVTVTADEPDAAAHVADSSDAHDASAISIVDTGGYFTGTDVEAALQELGSGGGGGGITVEEVDGSPTGAITKLVLPNGTVGIVGSVATYTPAGGGGGPSDYVSGASGTGHITIPGMAGDPDIVPASPHASDDEFATLSGWTTLGTLDTLDATTFPSHVYMVRASIGYAVNGIYKAAPSMPFTMTAKVSDWFCNSNFVSCGLMLLDSTPTALYTLGPVFGGYASVPSDFAPAKWTSRTARASAADFNTSVGLFGKFYLRFVVTNSTTVASAYSFDGKAWFTTHTAQNPGFTVANVGLNIVGHTAGGDVRAMFDWVRFS